MINQGVETCEGGRMRKKREEMISKNKEKGTVQGKRKKGNRERRIS